jgi:SEFIR domain
MSVSSEREPHLLRVFVSYSQHDPASHSPQVLAFANALLDDGVEVELDQYHQNELIDWPRWCEEQLRRERSDFVLMICSAEYKRRIENRVEFDKGRGVFWEGNLIYNALYKAKANERFIPILFSDETDDALPSIVEGWTRFEIGAFGIANRDPGYMKLYRFLTKQPMVAKPKIGQIKILSPVHPDLKSLRSISSVTTLRVLFKGHTGRVYEVFDTKCDVLLDREIIGKGSFKNGFDLKINDLPTGPHTVSVRFKTNRFLDNPIKVPGCSLPEKPPGTSGTLELDVVIGWTRKWTWKYTQDFEGSLDAS